MRSELKIKQLGEIVMSDKNKVIRTVIISIAIIVASSILAWAIRDGARYLGDAINSGLFHIGNTLQ